MNGETVPNLFDLTSPAGRLKTYLNYTFNDHAFLRLGFQNAHWISEELVRTNQPWPHQLVHWKRQGVRTIINLRGGFDGSFYALEKEACARLGLELVNFTVASREVPSVAQVLGAKRLFERIAYPALMHCKSGADRAGVMSVLYMHFRQGRTIREAMDQLGAGQDRRPRLHLRALSGRGRTGRPVVLRVGADPGLRPEGHEGDLPVADVGPPAHRGTAQARVIAP